MAIWPILISSVYSTILKYLSNYCTNLLTDTLSILPVNGAGKDGLTVAEIEFKFRWVVAYERSLANSSRSCAT